MGDEVLNESEVESLLSAMASRGGGSCCRAATAVRSDFQHGAEIREKISPYDFKRPERVGKEQMRALQTLHEGFSRNFAAGLSAMLRSMVEVKLTSVDQLTYSEFVFSLENPTCFNLLKADPLEGNLILDINPSILYPIIDRLLGGGREAGLLARRPLTEIELRIVARITNLFLEGLHHAWENVLDLTLEVVRVESNPQLAQIVPPNEVVVVISFEVALGEIRGMVNLCIPYNSIERISGKLSTNSWVSYGRRAFDARKRPADRPGGTKLVGIGGGPAGEHADHGGRPDQPSPRRHHHYGEGYPQPAGGPGREHPEISRSPGAFKGHKAIRIDDTIANPAEAIGE